MTPEQSSMVQWFAIVCQLFILVWSWLKISKALDREYYKGYNEGFLAGAALSVLHDPNSTSRWIKVK